MATLEATPSCSPDAEYMRSVLQQTNMPNLTNLAINYSDDSTPETASNAPLIFNVPVRQFPSLTALQLRGSAAIITPPLASQLRCLEMGRANGPPLSLPLAPFFDCLASFPLLEDLNLQRCFAKPAPAPAPVAVSPGPAHRSRLKSVRIADYPPNIGKIMSALIIPTSALVHLTGDTRGVSARRRGLAVIDMLPRRIDCLYALQSLKRIFVVSTSKECEIRGEQQDERSAVTLHLETDLENATDDVSAKARAALFNTLVENLPKIFPAQTTADLSCTGPVYGVSESAWIAALAAYPHLRHLSVADELLISFPTILFGALNRPSRRGETLPCPKLDFLELYGDIRGEEGQLRVALLCLQGRKTEGGPAVLRKLIIGLYSEVPLPAPVLAEYGRAFSQLARECIFENRIQPRSRRVH